LELWRLLAHNHWLTLNLNGFELRLCARCSGYLLGFTLPLLISGRFAKLSESLDVRIQLLACFLLALPYAVDWVTQSWGMRESSNKIRVVTGILLGIDIFLFSRLNIIAERAIFVNAALLVILVGHLGKFKRTS
jgi:uncharacterized membrane protein